MPEVAEGRIVKISGKFVAIIVKKERYSYLVKLPVSSPETLDKAFSKLGNLVKFYVEKGKLVLVDIESGSA